MPTPFDLGIPVRSINWVRLFPGRNRAGAPILLASMGQNFGQFFVTEIDLQTGHCTQHRCDTRESDYPTAAYMDPDTGVLYVGVAHSGHLYRFDPNRPAGQRCLEDLGCIDPQHGIFPCAIDKDPEGSLWIGAYGGCCLTRVRPRNLDRAAASAKAEAGGDAFTMFGRMDEVDQYFYPLCGRDGTIAGTVKMCDIHVVALDPRTGEKRSIGPTVNTNREGNEAAHKFSLFKGVDGLLYLTSTKGQFRIQGLEAIPVSSVPAAMPAATLPDGTKAEFLDAAAQVFRKVRLTSPSGATRDLDLDWVGGGTSLFMMHEGPDGKLYGSSFLPEHLFRCEVDGSGMIDLGQCSVSTGEAYSMANLDGKMYIASYPAARLSIYDPAKPYRFGEDEAANPRDVGRVDEVAYRPRSMLAGPEGKVWIASIPDYGMWGGTLASFDPRKSGPGKLVSHRHIVQDCSVVSLAWSHDLQRILVGTDIAGGSGTQPRAKEAALVVWDPVLDKEESRTNFGITAPAPAPGLRSVSSIIDVGGFRAYAIVRDEKSHLLLIDLRDMSVIERSTFTEEEGWPHEVSLRRGPGNVIYGASGVRFYRILPGSTRRETIWSSPPGNDTEIITVPGPIIGRRFFFASHHRLRCIDLP